MNSEDRLERLDRLPDAGRAHGAAQKVAGRDRRLQRRREEGGRVQTRVERRDVGHDHRLARVTDTTHERRQPVEKLLLGQLARGRPRCRRRPAHAHELVPGRQLDHLLVDVAAIGRVRQDRVDLEVVVVARHQVDRNPGAIEALRGEIHPLAHPARDVLVEGTPDHRGIRLHRCSILLGDPHRVIPEIGDRALQIRQLTLRSRDPALAEDIGSPHVAAARRNDRNERFASQIARDQRGIHLVDVGLHGVDELSPGALGGVDVAADVKAEGLSHGRFPQVRRGSAALGRPTAGPPPVGHRVGRASLRARIAR